ncbi:MAG: tRNA 2-thiouridine(34) synthase MnmA [Pseudomonadales bacterium]
MNPTTTTAASHIEAAIPAAPKTANSVVVGLSGGVDSAVAALLLKRAGYRVIGLFMKNWEEDDGTEYCTALTDLEDAQQVATTLDIELRTANFAAEYWDNVFEDFLAEYAAGRTPNPDIACNREIKFRYFADYASTLGADFIATGHYARIAQGSSGPVLSMAADANKDQTYFLQAVSAAQLRNVLFPLGQLTKQVVRQLAASEGLANHAKKDSTGICFIGERRFADFLQRYLPRRAGRIVDSEGRTIGTHQGAHTFTVGQRQGLQLGGIAGRSEAPWYVLAKHLPSNTVVATQDPCALNARWLAATPVNWLDALAPALPLRCVARIRHRQAPQSCTVSGAADGSITVRFDAPQRAINPGQYVALYEPASPTDAPQRCLGGAKIVRCEQPLLPNFAAWGIDHEATNA